MWSKNGASQSLGRVPAGAIVPIPWRTNILQRQLAQAGRVSFALLSDLDDAFRDNFGDGDPRGRSVGGRGARPRKGVTALASVVRECATRKQKAPVASRSFLGEPELRGTGPAYLL
jgi:hypothetical protein